MRIYTQTLYILCILGLLYSCGSGILQTTLIFLRQHIVVTAHVSSFPPEPMPLPLASQLDTRTSINQKDPALLEYYSLEHAIREIIPNEDLYACMVQAN